MKKKNILICGASGHSKMIIDIIHKNNSHKIIGFVDSFKPKGTDVFGYKIIGNKEDISKLKEEYNVYEIVLGIGDNYTRYQLMNYVNDIAPELKFPSVIHPSVIMANDIIIPDGTVVMAGAIIDVGAKIGKFCILNTNSSLGHDCIIEDFISLSPGVSIGGNVKIGLCTAIGLKAGVNNNINIGNHTVIGSGSVVVKDIGDFKVAYGVPAKVKAERSIDTKYL